MTDTSSYPKPKTITGGCLCEAVRYRVTFPDDHDFVSGDYACQCTQCRKQTGSLFFSSFHVPDSALEWTSSPLSTEGSGYPLALKTFSASEGTQRGFCGTCGSFIFWRRNQISLTLGSVDALYLFGQGAGGEGEEAKDVPEGGFGRALSNGKGSVLWCENDIPGITDDMALLHRGKRFQKDIE